AIDCVLKARPEVYNHNMETVPRLYRRVRGRADYQRSLDLLSYVKARAPATVTKSGLMLGLGETVEELFDVLADLRGAGCDTLTLGQYLAPTRQHCQRIELRRRDVARDWNVLERRRSSMRWQCWRGRWASPEWSPDRSCAPVITPT